MKIGIWIIGTEFRAQKWTHIFLVNWFSASLPDNLVAEKCFSTNNSVKIGYLHGNIMNFAPTSHHMPKMKELNIRAECKSYNYWTPREKKNMRINLHDLEIGKTFLDMASKSKVTNEKDKLNFIKIKNVELQRPPSRRWENNSQSGGQYL